MTQPPIVRYAGYLVAAQGVAALVMAAVLLVRAFAGADQHIVNGYGTAVWFILIGAGVLTGGWALVTGRRWGRGIAVPTNLLLLPIAWYVITSHHVVYGVLVGLLALSALAMLFSPSSVQWMAGRD
ncbi:MULTISPECIES: hypothetical protein [Actinomycetes]|uniref:Membrane protein n=1 Tax=Mycolicibacterium neoaurum VKM Ac-1815D TaxID=700508 RepID=V5XAG9_MYCNE|nr:MULTISPECIES: hypothetical protein [Actinomycetes]AHC24656.1 membrane protein [Mycolicibacterium neoaurum VKM Ac-1815D]AMO05222.1 membrane protein [Mycolicibacterium neoaurum]AXK76474.1 hypothetical protein DXK33_16560 [Mycolicibacterium neoaurum]KJQ49260.1 membrane protein [Mycolicibacterium neoaurum]KUM08475.1 hypothetical protein AVZ31_10805 [Mycolicibacterium neoaurum]